MKERSDKANFVKIKFLDWIPSHSAVELSLSMQQAISLRPQHLHKRRGKKEKGSEEKIKFCSVKNSQDNENRNHRLASLFG